MTNKVPAALLIASILAAVPVDAPRQTIRFSHKEIVKREKPVKTRKPGRNHPAKNYNQDTHTWRK